MSRFFLVLIFLSFFYSTNSYGSENFYKVLNVPKDATQEQIKKAFKRIAMKNHPDRLDPNLSKQEKKERTETFMQAKKAYDVLRDPEQRSNYDKFGHEEFMQSSASQASEDSFSKIFEDIFVKEDTKESSERKNYSEKMIYHFQIILKNTMNLKSSKGDPKQLQKLNDLALKELLKSADSPKSNKKTRQRILNDFYSEVSKEKIESILKHSKGLQKHSSSSSLTPLEDLPLYKALKNFLDKVEYRYLVQEISRKERIAIEIFHRFSFFRQNHGEFLENKKQHSDLLKKQQSKTLTELEKKELNTFEKQIKKDIRIFRKILSALGLPGQTHNEFLLRAYLDGLKSALFENQKLSEDRRLLEHRDNTQSKSSYKFSDKEIMTALRKVKFHFDETQYQNLKIMSNPLGAHFLKSFPTQFLVFQMAIGASIYRQSLTDPYTYGAETNPEMLTETMKHSLTPSGVLSFFIFVAVSQQINYRLYSLGRFIDGKSLKTPLGNFSFNGKISRAIAPGVGLGLGFFVSSLFDELLHDPHLKQCVKGLYSKDKNTEQENLAILFGESASNIPYYAPHIEPCEQFYINWTNSEKWKHYAVDIATLIGSGTLSHALLRYALTAVRSTAIGSRILLWGGRVIGPVPSGLLHFFVNLYLFMETHKYLDKWIGQPVKEQLTASGIKDELINLNGFLDRNLSNILTWSNSTQSFNSDSDEAKNPLWNKISGFQSETESYIKRIGRKFQSWTMVESQHYSQSAQLWMKKQNQLILPYEGSSQMLKDMFFLSHTNNFYLLKRERIYELEDVFPPNHIAHELEIDNSEIKGWDSKNQVYNWHDINQPMKIISSETQWNNLKNVQCPQWLSDLNDENNEFCEYYFSNRQFDALILYGMADMIYNYMQRIPFQKEYIHTNNFMSYIGRDFNQMFSSDPDYSIKYLSYDERFQLAKTLLSAGLDFGKTLEYFDLNEISNFQSAQCTSFYPNYQNNEEQNELHKACTTEFVEEINYKVKLKLTFKFLNTAIYLLKDLSADLEKGFQYSKSYSKNFMDETYLYNPKITNSLVFRSIQPIIDQIEIYKKGEKYFMSAEQILSAQKESLDSFQQEEMETRFSLSLNPYLFIKNMLCGAEKLSQNHLFSVPLFFPKTNIQIYSFFTKKFESIESACKTVSSSYKHSGSLKRVHELLFNQPVQIQGENQTRRSYENLYSALEYILKTNYSSIQELTDEFQTLSQNKLDEIGSLLLSDLDSITENYYKTLIHKKSPINSQSSIEDFQNYYHKNRVLFDIRSFTGGLKGLEISLFQINYWMNILKKTLFYGDLLKYNEQTLNQYFYNLSAFDKNNFEKHQEKILQLLQSYHDSYKKDQGPYLLVPEKNFFKKINEIFHHREKGRMVLEELCGFQGNRFAILQNEYASSSLPILMDPEIILAHILSVSLPAWHNQSQISNLRQAYIVHNGNPWETLIYSIFSELSKSLDSFFEQLNPLQLKESAQNQLPNSTIDNSNSSSVCSERLAQKP